jgi:RNA polymerase sigma-70 factor (ECF subfamily)
VHWTDSALARTDLTAAEPHGDAATPLQEEVTALFDELRRPVLRYLLSCRLPVQDAEEVVQDVFLALYRHLEAGKPRHNLRGWVFRVAHNLAMKRHNAVRDRLEQTVAPERAGGITAVDPAPGPEELLSARQRRDRLLAVVAALPDRDRSCLTLRAEGLRYREIAGILDVSVGSVALSLARALARLTRADEG